jgi:carbon storage regulator
MLILTRRPVETIYIGEEVTITVLGVVGNQVRFGIEAPRHITVDRAEIHERKKRAAQASGNPPPRDDDSRAQSAANGNVLQGSPTEDEEQHASGNVATLKLRRP